MELLNMEQPKDDQFALAKGVMAAGKEPTSAQDAGLGVLGRMAQAQAKKTAQDASQEVQAKGMQLKAQSTASTEKNKQVASKLTSQAVNLRAEFQDKASALMQSYQQNKDKVSLGRYKANTEQMGFYLRLQDKTYVDKMLLEGNKARLSNAYDMKYAQQMAVFADEKDLLKGDLYFKRLMGMDARQFQAELVNMDIESALKLASSQSDAANSAMIAQGIGQGVATGATLYGQYQGRK